uniref:Uncharacterized protein n=1 Tax=Davidia involucrata TaxID=16924 RepID=A0A5B7BDE1_DAVIN
MKKSPIHPKYEAGDYGDYGFDPQVDFSQFLEEAREHACKENSSYPEEAGKKQLGEVKKSKKSWKRSLFSWWKAEKRGNPSMEAPTSCQISNPRRGYVSGPICGTGGGGGGGASCKPWRPTSGPLTTLFHPTKRVENEIPYMCLDQLNNHPHGVQSYGPVYLVT